MKTEAIFENTMYYANFEGIFVSSNKDSVFVSNDNSDRKPILQIDNNNYHLFKMNDETIFLRFPTDNKILLINPYNQEIKEIDGNLYGILRKLSNGYLELNWQDKFGISKSEEPLIALWTKPKNNHFIFFNNDNYLFSHFFQQDYKISCISIRDGSEVWSKDFTGVYWYNDLTNGRVNSNLISGYNTVSGNICLLSFSGIGMVALEAGTGNKIWEDTTGRYFMIHRFKVYNDRFYQFVCNYNDKEDFYIRIGDVNTGKEINFKRIKDIIPNVDKERNFIFVTKNERYTVTEKYLIFDDMEFLYVLDKNSLELVDSIKIPFKKGFNAGAWVAPVYENGYIFFHTHNKKFPMKDLYIFKLDE